MLGQRMPALYFTEVSFSRIRREVWSQGKGLKRVKWNLSNAKYQQRYINTNLVLYFQGGAKLKLQGIWGAHHMWLH